MRPGKGRYSAGSAGIALLCATLTVVSGGCARQQEMERPDVAYVKGAGVPLRDPLGPDSVVKATLQPGEQVEIVATRPQWTQVYTRAGETGWVPSEMLASEGLYQEFRDLAVRAAELPSQGTALARRDVNLHLEPARASETFYRLPEKKEVEVVGHQIEIRDSSAGSGEEVMHSQVEEAVGVRAEWEVKRYEDWLFVRGSEGEAGWALERYLEMNPPLEVAQYSEGLKIRAWFVLNQEQDNGQTHNWYLWATIRSTAGMPFDFEEIRVFVWNPAMSRYETSYRERNMVGFYPIEVSEPEPGGSPAFRMSVEDAAGRRFLKSYRMVGRRVLPERQADPGNNP